MIENILIIIMVGALAVTFKMISSIGELDRLKKGYLEHYTMLVEEKNIELSKELAKHMKQVEEFSELNRKAFEERVKNRFKLRTREIRSEYQNRIFRNEKLIDELLNEKAINEMVIEQLSDDLGQEKEYSNTLGLKVSKMETIIKENGLGYLMESKKELLGDKNE